MAGPFSVTPRRYYLFDCCWVCHKPLKTPLHACYQRHLGLPRVHEQCFAEGLFETLHVGTILSVSRNEALIEHVPLNHAQLRHQPLGAISHDDDAE